MPKTSSDHATNTFSLFWWVFIVFNIGFVNSKPSQEGHCNRRGIATAPDFAQSLFAETCLPTGLTPHYVNTEQEFDLIRKATSRSLLEAISKLNTENAAKSCPNEPKKVASKKKKKTAPHKKVKAEKTTHADKDSELTINTESTDIAFDWSYWLLLTSSLVAGFEMVVLCRRMRRYYRLSQQPRAAFSIKLEDNTNIKVLTAAIDGATNHNGLVIHIPKQVQTNSIRTTSNKHMTINPTAWVTAIDKFDINQYFNGYFKADLFVVHQTIINGKCTQIQLKCNHLAGNDIRELIEVDLTELAKRMNKLIPALIESGRRAQRQCAKQHQKPKRRPASYGAVATFDTTNTAATLAALNQLKIQQQDTARLLSATRDDLSQSDADLRTRYLDAINRIRTVSTPSQHSIDTEALRVLNDIISSQEFDNLIKRYLTVTVYIKDDVLCANGVSNVNITELDLRHAIKSIQTIYHFNDSITTRISRFHSHFKVTISAETLDDYSLIPQRVTDVVKDQLEKSFFDKAQRAAEENVLQQRNNVLTKVETKMRAWLQSIDDINQQLNFAVDNSATKKRSIRANEFHKDTSQLRTDLPKLRRDCEQLSAMIMRYRALANKYRNQDHSELKSHFDETFALSKKIKTQMLVADQLVQRWFAYQFELTLNHTQHPNLPHPTTTILEDDVNVQLRYVDNTWHATVSVNSPTAMQTLREDRIIAQQIVEYIKQHYQQAERRMIRELRAKIQSRQSQLTRKNKTIAQRFNAEFAALLENIDIQKRAEITSELRDLCDRVELKITRAEYSELQLTVQNSLSEVSRLQQNDPFELSTKLSELGGAITRDNYRDVQKKLQNLTAEHKALEQSVLRFIRLTSWANDVINQYKAGNDHHHEIAGLRIADLLQKATLSTLDDSENQLTAIELATESRRNKPTIESATKAIVNEQKTLSEVKLSAHPNDWEFRSTLYQTLDSLSILAHELSVCALLNRAYWPLMTRVRAIRDDFRHTVHRYEAEQHNKVYHAYFNAVNTAICQIDIQNPATFDLTKLSEVQAKAHSQLQSNAGNQLNFDTLLAGLTETLNFLKLTVKQQNAGTIAKNNHYYRAMSGCLATIGLYASELHMADPARYFEQFSAERSKIDEDIRSFSLPELIRWTVHFRSHVGHTHRKEVTNQRIQQATQCFNDKLTNPDPSSWSAQLKS